MLGMVADVGYTAALEMAVAHVKVAMRTIDRDATATELTTVECVVIVVELEESDAAFALFIVSALSDLADGFIALPGGFGTLEEFFEVITWAQLGLHSKPCGLLNVNGYYDSLLRFLDTAVERRLLREENRNMVLVASDAIDLLDRMQAFIAPTATKKVDTART